MFQTFSFDEFVCGSNFDQQSGLRAMAISRILNNFGQIFTSLYDQNDPVTGKLFLSLQPLYNYNILFLDQGRNKKKF